MELLEAFVAHRSTFHGPVFPGIRPRRAHTATEGPGRWCWHSYSNGGIWAAYPYPYPCPALDSISRLLRRRFQMQYAHGGFLREAARCSSNISDLATRLSIYPFSVARM
ncbi:hypothetical protein ACQKWADRAFT_308468 [Trichoderma austrokoningii]